MVNVLKWKFFFLNLGADPKGPNTTVGVHVFFILGKIKSTMKAFIPIIGF